MTPVRAGLAAAATVGLIAVATVLGSVVVRRPATPAPLTVERSIGLFDPHLHLSVADVHVVDTPDRSPGRRLWIVTLCARNDAARIDIDPSRLAIRAWARDGRSFPALERAEGELRFHAALRRPLGPGEAYDQSFLFEIPLDASAPFLVVETGGGPLTWLPATVRHALGERVELAL